MRRLVSPLLVAALVLPACGGDDGTAARSGASPTTGASAPGLDVEKPEVTVPDGPPPATLQIRDITVGTGPAAKAGDELLVHYVGVAYSTKKQFDASWDGGQPFPLVLGTGSVIPGWDRGLVGMRGGGRRELVIPPDLAYGERGIGPIGPNETLVFVIDLIRLQPA